MIKSRKHPININLSNNLYQIVLLHIRFHQITNNITSKINFLVFYKKEINNEVHKSISSMKV